MCFHAFLQNIIYQGIHQIKKKEELAILHYTADMIKSREITA